MTTGFKEQGLLQLTETFHDIVGYGNHDIMQENANVDGRLPDGANEPVCIREFQTLCAPLLNVAGNQESSR